MASEVPVTVRRREAHFIGLRAPQRSSSHSSLGRGKLRWRYVTLRQLALTRQTPSQLREETSPLVDDATRQRSRMPSCLLRIREAILSLSSTSPHARVDKALLSSLKEISTANGYQYITLSRLLRRVLQAFDRVSDRNYADYISKGCRIYLL